ncbi:hypothetical protein ABBQ32_004144 [Trebouxia sp. C0010 RCD-2024]
MHTISVRKNPSDCAFANCDMTFLGYHFGTDEHHQISCVETAWTIYAARNTTTTNSTKATKEYLNAAANNAYETTASFHRMLPNPQTNRAERATAKAFCANASGEASSCTKSICACGTVMLRKHLMLITCSVSAKGTSATYFVPRLL